MCTCTGVDMNCMSRNVCWVVLSDLLYTLAVSKYPLPNLPNSPGVYILAGFGCSVPSVKKNHENWTPHRGGRESYRGEGGGIKHKETRGKSPEESSRSGRSGPSWCCTQEMTHIQTSPTEWRQALQSVWFSLSHSPSHIHTHLQSPLGRPAACWCCEKRGSNIKLTKRGDSLILAEWGEAEMTKPFGLHFHVNFQMEFKTKPAALCFSIMWFQQQLTSKFSSLVSFWLTD